MEVPEITSLTRSAEKVQSHVEQLCEILEVDNLYNAVQKVRRLMSEEKIRGRLTAREKTRDFLEGVEERGGPRSTTRHRAGDRHVSV